MRRTAIAASGKGLGTKAASFLRQNCLYSLVQLKANLKETWLEDLRGMVSADSKGQGKGSYLRGNSFRRTMTSRKIESSLCVYITETHKLVSRLGSGNS